MALQDATIWRGYLNSIILYIIIYYNRIDANTACCFQSTTAKLAFGETDHNHPYDYHVFGRRLIPTYLLVKDLGLVNTMWTLILPGVVSVYSIPFIHYAQPSVIWTSDEAEAIAGATDMQTYIETMEAKFITGDSDIDAEWDNYVSAVKSYGYDEILAAYTSAWTRYAEVIEKLQ